VIAWDDRSHGVDWHLELDRALLLPERLVGGRLRISSDHAVEARALVVALRAEEHWRHRETTSDGRGHTTTRVVTSTADAARVPIQVSGPLRLEAGQPFERAFELPVPPLGPASLEADDVGLDWTIEAKLDIDDSFDSRIERPVAVAQPTALLHAGVVRLGEFALYDSVDLGGGDIAGSIQMRPAPLVCGEPFTGTATVRASGSIRLQEIRAELRVTVKATVSGGEEEEITAWAGQISPAIELSDRGTQTFALVGTLPARLLPTIELPHGRTDATFRLILAKALATDIHLVRDVAIATTAEL
jgi:hypothetical protein